ncbi:Cyclic AMP-dependent transcription factor ATF-2-like protein 2 [Colletotrichum chlorophyti]|uniref:Cyclic AMP-dependent transcription factor ATF-2-like protein 2 n=1 Tax=Colletotrichum chlorophyti TaxID=708187 RepID=A0A1Q8RAI3_9PEZI|nr:Cyclic AMP-dependent transcription factor ATF-2-like protein 2 [Colletotrichum chlorophyti]
MEYAAGQLPFPLNPDSGRENVLQQGFVAPSALTTAPEEHTITMNRHSSTSSQSSRGWQDSPISNPVDSIPSPATSRHSSSISPPVDPLILSPVPETKPLPAETETAEPPKRRRGRPRLSESSPRATRATAAATAPTPAKVQKKTAARRTSTASASGADDSRDERGPDDKKNRIRARNREAAYKCRQKKQKGIEELQTQEAMAESVNRNLNAEAAMLRGEILMLKNMVLQHGGCGCSYIEEYISGAAQNLVQSSMAASASAPGDGVDVNRQPAMSGPEGDSFVDWKMFETDQKPLPGLGSESGFSGFDDVSSQGVRAQSQGAMMV